MRAGEISASFHGRDIFGPAAGRLACGANFEEAGPVVADPMRCDFAQARIERDPSGERRLSGEVLFADHYGNLQTNIPGFLLDSLGVKRGDRITVEVGRKREGMPFLRTYGDVPREMPLIFVASTGRLEIALNQASAAQRLGADRHAAVNVRRR